MWQIVLAEIGKGILAEIGSKILNSIMGGGQEPDIASIIAQAFQEFTADIKHTIESEFERAEYQNALNSMRTAQRAIRQYNLSPESRQDMLDEITFQLTSALTNMEAMGNRGLAGYMICAGLEVAILQERQRVLGGKELQVAVCDTVCSSQIHWTNMLNELYRWNESRFSRVNYNPLFDRDGETVLLYRVSYTFEGRRITGVASPNESGVAKLEQTRRDQIETERQTLYAATEPVRTMLADLEQWAISTEIVCPHDMSFPLKLSPTPESD